MSWSNIWAFIGSIFLGYEVDKAIIDAGGVATTPAIQVGSEGGKPLYARSQLCTDKNFPGG